MKTTELLKSNKTCKLVILSEAKNPVPTCQDEDSGYFSQKPGSRKTFNKYFSFVAFLFLIVGAIWSCSESSTNTNSNNNNNNNGNNLDTISLKIYEGYSFALKKNVSTKDSADIVSIIYAFNHVQNIGLWARKIKEFPAYPDTTALSKSEIETWTDTAPKFGEQKTPTNHYYYIIKTQNNEYYVIYTADIVRGNETFAYWVFKLTFKQIYPMD